MFSGLTVSAQDMVYERSIEPNLVISINQNITIPSNVKHLSSENSIDFDHEADIEWDKGYRYCWGSTQASQGDVKLDSYTRARFERTWFQGGGVYGDSGRKMYI